MGIIRRKLSPFIALDLGGSETGSPPARPFLDAVRSDLASLAGAPRRYAAALHAALTARRVPPMTLDLTQRTVTFHGVAEFEFALESRTEFPVRKIEVLMRRPAQELKSVATNIRQVEKRFAEVLTNSMTEPGSIGELMRELEVKLFSQDHDWRDIAEALNRQPPAFDEYKRIALVKYMQYLASRQNVLRSIYLEKTGLETGSDSPAVPAEAPGHAAGSSPPRATQEQDETQVACLKDTSIFELSQNRGASADGPEFRSIPRGETMRIRIEPGDEMDIRLCAHGFKLHCGEHFSLLDDSGARYTLRTGKNIVGRHAGNDIVINAAYRSVSRKHLIVEPESENTILITDISSHGTLIPAHYVG